MKKLNKYDFKGENAIKDDSFEEMEIPEWGGSISLRTLTINERLEFDSKFTDDKGSFKNINDPDMIYSLLSLGIVDENGERIFVGDDVNILKERNASVMQQIFLRILKLNYLQEDDTKKK